AWDGAALVIVVDAVRAEPAVPGRLHRLVLDRATAGPSGSVSSHGFGLGDTIGLALALDRMPGRLIVHAVAAGGLGPGTRPHPPRGRRRHTAAAAALPAAPPP